MNTFLGFGKQYVEKHYQKTGQRVYLHLKRTRKPVKYKKKKKIKLVLKLRAGLCLCIQSDTVFSLLKCN